MKADQGDLSTIAHGLLPTGFDPAALTPKGRDELRDAIEVVLKLADYRTTKLSLALEQLDRAAKEIERLAKLETAAKACLKAAGDYATDEGWWTEESINALNDLRAVLKEGE